jgi:hypothetical protein
MQLTALRHVSKQPHAELWPIVWKVKTFSFQEVHFGIDYHQGMQDSHEPRESCGSRVINVSELYEFFLRNTATLRLA